MNTGRGLYPAQYSTNQIRQIEFAIRKGGDDAVSSLSDAGFWCCFALELRDQINSSKSNTTGVAFD